MTHNRDMNSPKYSVHISGNGSTGFAREYVTAGSLGQVIEQLKRFATATLAETRTVDGETEPGAVADVYPYDPRDNADESHGDYPIIRYAMGPRGGVHAVSI